MAKNVDRGIPRSGHSQAETSPRVLRLIGRLKNFLSSAEGSRSTASKESSDTGYSVEWLEHCIKQVHDAYTLEDAIDWHREALGEINEHIAVVQNKEWPEDLKRQTIFDLMHIRLEYRMCLTNLRRAQASGETIRW